MTVDADKVHIGFEVPAHEREQWQEHADELDMSYSEYYRSMIRSGRRELGLADETPTNDDQNEDLETRIREQLSPDKPTQFDDLVESIVGELEDEVEKVLMELDDATYRPRSGGYVLER